MFEHTQAQLNAFIARAGFQWGWLNLESWARRMADQAVDEQQLLLSAIEHMQAFVAEHEGESFMLEMCKSVPLESIELLEKLEAQNAV